MKMMKKIGVSLLTAALALNMFLPSLPSRKIDAASELINVAPLESAATENSEYVKTSWQTCGVGSLIPVVQLDMGKSISEVVADLGENILPNYSSAAAEVRFTNPASEDDEGVEKPQEPAVTVVQSVTLDKPVAKLEVGNTLQLVAKVLPEVAEDKTVQWNSSDETIASVANGLITAHKLGTAKITVTSSNDKTATCEVIVQNQGTDIILNVGESYIYENTNGNADITDEADGIVINDEQEYNLISMHNHAQKNVQNSIDSFETVVNTDISLDECLFTLTSVENEENTYTIYNQSKNVYLRNSGANSFFGANPVNITLTPIEGKDAFGVYCHIDGGRSVIFYYKNMDFNANKGGYNGSWADGSYNLLMLKPKDTYSSDDIIPGYEQVSSVESESSYLIAFKHATGLMVLYPTNGTWNQTKYVETKPYNKLYEIGSTTLSSDTLSQYHLTFTQSEQGFTMQTSDGKYLSNTGKSSILTTDQKFFAIKSCSSRDGKFHFEALNGSSYNSYYYFHSPNNNVNINRMSTYEPNSDNSSTGTYDFMIFEHTDTYNVDDMIPGYAQVTDLTTISSDKKYIIVTEVKSGTYKGVYIIAPTGTIGNKNSLRIVEKGNTNITFTALDYGMDTVEIDGESLNFYVLDNLAYQKETKIFWNDGTEQSVRDSSKGTAHVTDGRSNDYNGYLDFGRDGDTRGSYIEIDLLKSSYIKTIDLYRYWNDGRTYRNTVVVVSNDKDFYTYKVVYNTDTNNMHGFGVGTDQTYSESADGKSFKVDTTARYIRVYMNGQSDTATTNHIVEVRAFGYEETPSEITTSTIMRTRDYTYNGDYLFESYYTDGYGLDAVTRDIFVKNISYVAKYVSPKVLSVKAQSKLDSTDGKLDVRFVSSVASLNLEKVGFKVELINGGNGSVKKLETTKVYNQIVANEDGETIFKKPELVFDNDASKHFFVAKLNNIPASAKTQSIKVTPYWLPLGYEDTEENYVEGVSRIFVVQELFDAAPMN